MTAFLIIGGVGLALVVVSLVMHDLFEGLFDGLFDALDIDVAAGLFSTPVIGAFLAAFGFGAALTMSSTEAGTTLAAVIGVGAGVVIGGCAYWLMRALMNMATDEPVRTNDLVGKPATVVTPIRPGGFGEISLVHAGQRMKFTARAERPVAIGSAVVVIAVNSPSSVVVETEDDFWGRSAPVEQGAN